MFPIKDRVHTIGNRIRKAYLNNVLIAADHCSQIDDDVKLDRTHPIKGLKRCNESITHLTSIIPAADRLVEFALEIDNTDYLMYYSYTPNLLAEKDEWYVYPLLFHYGLEF